MSYEITDQEFRENILKEARQIGKQMDTFLSNVETLQKEPVVLNIDMRWLNIARTDLQKGFMALERAINMPDHF